MSANAPHPEAVEQPKHSATGASEATEAPETTPTAAPEPEPEPEPEDDGYEAGRGADQLVADLSEKYFWINSLKCIGEVYFSTLQKGQAYRLINVRQFKDAVANWLYDKHPAVTGKPGKAPGDLWLAHPLRKDYEGIVFSLDELPANIRDQFYPDFQGFSVNPSPKGSCDKYWDHVRQNICNDNPELFIWLKSWMAFKVQNPGKVSRVAFVMVGPRGCGKGFFAQSLGKLFGQNFYHANRPGELTGRFNDHLRYKCLAFLDEMFWAGDKASEAAIKGLITEDTKIFERKFITPEVARNVIGVIIASNDAWAFPAGEHERRATVAEVSDAHMQDMPYFEAARKQLETGGYEKLLYDLLNFDIKRDGVSPEVALKTVALTHQQIQGMKPAHQLWYEILQDGRLAHWHGSWGENTAAQSAKGYPVASGELLYRIYADRVKIAGVGRAKYKPAFSQAIGELIPPVGCGVVQVTLTVDQDRDGNPITKVDRGWCLPDIAACREHFETLYPHIEWDIETENLDTVRTRKPARLNYNRRTRRDDD
jgi:hypothetical protein